jgi:hypothetical protein
MPEQVGKTSSPTGMAEKKRLSSGIPAGHSVFGYLKIEMRPFARQKNYCHRMLV